MGEDAPVVNPRLISMSRTGRFVAIRQKGGVDIVDAMGTSPRKRIAFDGLEDFTCVGSRLWTVADGLLWRHSLETGKEVDRPAPLNVATGRLTAAQGESACSALWAGASRSLIYEADGELLIEDLSKELEHDTFVAPLSERQLLVGEGKELRIWNTARREVVNVRRANTGIVESAGAFLGGRALAILEHVAEGSSFVVFKPNGAMIHSIELPRAMRCAFAESRGLALVHTYTDKLLAIDLRFGRVLAEADAPLPVEDLDIDANGKHLALGGFGDDDALSVLHVPYTDIFAGGGNLSVDRHSMARRHAIKMAPPTEIEGFDAISPLPPGKGAMADTPEETSEPVRDTGPFTVPQVPLVALGVAARPSVSEAASDAPPYSSVREHLDDLLDLIAARAARAIADAWDSGRLSLPALDSRPFEREVNALVGMRAANAPEELALAEKQLTIITQRLARRQEASLAANLALPFLDIVAQFRLSPVAAQALLVVAAPALRGEIARLYGVLANDENRPICDRHLVQLVLPRDDRTLRHAVASELASDAALIKYGLVRVLQAQNDQYLFAPLTVDPVLLARLRGDPLASSSAGEVASLRRAEPDSLETLAVPERLKRDLVIALAAPPVDDRAVRLVIRGRPGAGRRTLLAALAARSGIPLSVIDAERLPRGGRALSSRLRIELHRAGLRGALACVSGLEALDGSDAETIEHLREVFRSHPGPVTFRTTPEFKPPLDPGYLSFSIPALNETERLAFWRAALEEKGIVAKKVEQLASRFRIGPGTIAKVIAATAARRAADPDSAEDASADLDAAARQHIASRLGNVATHVARLARWEQVALPEDVIDSIREFLGRVQHRRTVYEAWGYDRRMTTSRGLTALFHGPPGTGKSMVAGLIARELSLDLYRVDLAQVTSKWIGETEKNLAEVFDAAEDGQAVILFDEADALFAKRTEVKSSVDRYANLEVNYLLQRFDSFEGVAILTTNMEGSLDNAFKRRLSLRLMFPFPDEDMRVRLWAAHMPPEVPTKGDFDFAELAKRFPMSGGYIRNSALRAAFLAAQEGVPLSQDHIVRAIQLEYREMGKLAPGGRME